MDGLIVKQPYASLIAEGKKKWELRSRKPPQDKIKHEILLLSSGYVLGKIKIVNHWLATKKDLEKHVKKHHSPVIFLEDDFESNVWEIDVVTSYSKPKKYHHPIGARVWVNNVNLNRQPSLNDFV
jgi:hypothetical protein